MSRPLSGVILNPSSGPAQDNRERHLVGLRSRVARRFREIPWGQTVSKTSSATRWKTHLLQHIWVTRTHRVSVSKASPTHAPNKGLARTDANITTGRDSPRRRLARRAEHAHSSLPSTHRRAVPDRSGAQVPVPAMQHVQRGLGRFRSRRVRCSLAWRDEYIYPPPLRRRERPLSLSRKNRVAFDGEIFR